MIQAAKWEWCRTAMSACCGHVRAIESEPGAGGKPAESFLDNARQRRGLMVINRQTFHCLTPYFSRHWDAYPAQEDGFRTFAFGDKRVIVATTWTLSMQPNRAAGQEGLPALLDQAARERPDLAPDETPVIDLVFVGWSAPLAGELMAANRQLLPGDHFVTTLLALPSFAAVRLDMVRFRRLVREGVPRH